MLIVASIWSGHPYQELTNVDTFCWLPRSYTYQGKLLIPLSYILYNILCCDYTLYLSGMSGVLIFVG